MVLDLGGAAGRILSACEIVPEPLQPSLSYNGSLVEILDNVRRIGETVSGKEKRDVFISYAHKDGTEVATQLKVHLEAGVDRDRAGGSEGHGGYSPTLAGKISRSTGQHSISQIAAEIARVVQQKPELPEEPDDAPAGAFEEQHGHQV